jgi:hypothetical protein
MSFTGAGRTASMIEQFHIAVVLPYSLDEGPGELAAGVRNDIVRGNRDFVVDIGGMGGTVTRAGPAMLNRLGVVGLGAEDLLQSTVGAQSESESEERCEGENENTHHDAGGQSSTKP